MKDLLLFKKIVNLLDLVKFCNMLVIASLWHIYHVTKAVQTELLTVLSNAMVDGVLICSALLHSMSVILQKI